MNISKTPHDDFFYQVMSRKDKAMIFFERYLPKKVLAMTNLETIVLAESKHVSDEGISLYNDVLYRCEFVEGQSGYLFAMCEHQSTPEAQMPLRLLKYNIATREKHIKQDLGRFPVIVNIVLYHGSQPWNYSTAFSDYYTNPVLGKEFLDMAPYTLISIPKISKESIYQDRELGFCFEAFRCTSDPDPYEAFKSTMNVSIFKTYFHALPKKLRNLVLAYLGNCIDYRQHSLEDLVNLVSINSQEKKEIMTSIAQAIGQEYEKKGMQKGMQKGMREEKLHIAKHMLSNMHLDTKTVSQATGLREEELIRLQETKKY